MGTKTGKGRRLWQHADHSAESLFLCSAAGCSLDFKGYLTLTPKITTNKGCRLFYCLRGIAECHSEFTTSWEMVMCWPVSLSSGSLCHFVWKNWIFFIFFFPKWTYITHPFLPHPPLTRHAIGMKGVTQVEQDGFTSANVGNKTSAVLIFCLDAGQTAHVDTTSCFLTDALSPPCDPHWQGGLCHTPGCNGTNAARDTAYCAFLPVHWTLCCTIM